MDDMNVIWCNLVKPNKKYLRVRDKRKNINKSFDEFFIIKISDRRISRSLSS